MINRKPAKSKLPVLAQVCKLIPPHLVAKLARKHGVDKQARTFTPWSQVVSLLFAQLAHSIGLNDVCDTLRIHSRWLGSLRGAVAPTRNTLFATVTSWVFVAAGRWHPRATPSRTRTRRAGAT